jgi:hypothetical protein
MSARLRAVSTAYAVVLLGLLICPVAGQAAGLATRVAVEDDPAGAAVRVLGRAGAMPPLMARVALNGPSDPQAESRLSALERAGIDVWLTLPAPAAEADVPAWRGSLRTLLARPRSTVALLEVDVDRQPRQLAGFAVQIAATEGRVRRQDLQVALGGAAMNEAMRRREIYTNELAPYIDLLAIDDAPQDVVDWLQAVDPLARIAVTPAVASDPTAGGERRLIDGVLQDLGTAVVARAWPAAAFTPAATAALTTLAPLLRDEVSLLDREAMGLTLQVSGRDVIDQVPHRRLFDVDTFSTYLVYWGDASADPLELSLLLPIDGVPGIDDLLAGAHVTATQYSRDAATNRVRMQAPLTGRPMLINFNEGAAGVLSERSSVSAERQLSIGEIISRHQQQQAAQDALVRDYVASARMQQYFRPSITDPGYDVVTENRYFVAGENVEWEELSFSVNGSTWTTDRPPFPLLQPEKVLALPLQLRFDEGYRYELAGTERVDGYDCYVVRFEPLRRDVSLYKGTVWIDRRSFARIRVQAVQGGLQAPVVSNEETQRYVPVEVPGNRPVFLFGSLSAKQIMLIAGRNLLVEKTVTFTDFRVNAPDFDSLRAAARDSDRIMYKETDAGLRYFTKQDGQRVISDRPTASVKALAMGATFDPSYSFPLPILGIDYLNFAFGSPNTQLAVLFAGVLAAGNIQHPKFGADTVDASVDFFAIAAPSSDRLYTPAGENEDERILTWPMTTGLNLGWQATPFIKATLQYQARFDAYVHDTTTPENYRLPASTLTNGIGGSFEYQRGGYGVTINGTWFARDHWTDWGLGPPTAATAAAAARSRTYMKYTATVSRTFMLGPFQKLHVDGAWFDGRDLDRFVKYQFGMFDATRIHGVPVSGVRFARLAMVRGSYSFNVFDQYRFDLFVDHAWGRDEPSDPVWQSVPGIGAAVNFRAPWNTILRADLGKSFLPGRYGGLGSTTLQIMLLKPLR